jgi:hypothetical protein
MEISIFGPGKGEAIAVHLGDGDWITVDSCRNQATGEHALLDYFDAMGVDISEKLRLVIGTHAHDDHIAGLADLFSRAPDAQFVTSAAATTDEFFAVVEADADIERQIRQSVRAEYRQIFERVQVRGHFADGRQPLLNALQQRLLWSRQAREGMPGASVIALSPSDTAIQRSKRYLAEGSAKVGERKRLAAADPNEFAVALWVQFGDVTALLGADLIIGPEGCGWKAVLGSHGPSTRASIYKVPHHGSPNADHEAVWSDLLSDQVVSLVAPFRSGSVIRPSDTDIDRIVEKSSTAFITAQPKPPAPSKATKRARASLSGVATNVRDPFGHIGHVRARATPPSEEWDVVLVDPAHQLVKS